MASTRFIFAVSKALHEQAMNEARQRDLSLAQVLRASLRSFVDRDYDLAFLLKAHPLQQQDRGEGR